MSRQENCNLWQLAGWFPSHCGSSDHVDVFYYAALHIEDAIATHKSLYPHSTVRGCKHLGSVNMISVPRKESEV